MLLPFLHTRHPWRKVEKMDLYIAYQYLTLVISVQLRNLGSYLSCRFCRADGTFVLALFVNSTIVCLSYEADATYSL